MKYFTISELIKSNKAIENKIWNGATREIEDRLIALVDNVLDPVREKYGNPILVSSGYRCRKLNNITRNASDTSQHMEGYAADICTKGGRKSNYRVALEILKQNNFDQLIFEDVNTTNLEPSWVHVSYVSKDKNRHTVWKKIEGKNGYIQLNPVTLKPL